MSLTASEIKQIRRNIGDTPKLYTEHITVTSSTTYIYKLQHKNLSNYIQVEINGNLLNPTTDYTVDKPNGVLTISNSVVLAVNDLLTVLYDYTSLQDTEIEEAFNLSGGTIDSASLMCIDWILADAVKLYDYTIESEDMKLSQVVKHLQDLREIYRKKVEEEKQKATSQIKICTYNTDLSEDNQTTKRDISII